MAARWEIRIDGLDKINGRLKGMIQRFPEKAGQAMFTSALGVVVPAVQQTLRDERRVMDGDLFKSITARVVSSSSKGITVDIGAIGVPYALDVELGTPATNVEESERKKILRWSQKKMGLTDGSRGSPARLHAGAVIRTIRGSGRKPHPYIVPTFDLVKDRFVSDFATRLGKII